MLRNNANETWLEQAHGPTKTRKIRVSAELTCARESEPPDGLEHASPCLGAPPLLMWEQQGKPDSKGNATSYLLCRTYLLRATRDCLPAGSAHCEASLDGVSTQHSFSRGPGDAAWSP